MADVQLEHGYTRLANRLLEAIIEARFSERQMNVLLVLLRLTYGWRRRSVQLTELELAERVGAINGTRSRAGGSFRSDLYELIREGVVVRIDGSSDRRGVMSWGLNKDFGAWGNFSVSPAKLAARWDAKPVSNKLDETAIAARPTSQKQTASQNGTWPESGPDDTEEWPDSGPSNEGSWPDNGPLSGLSTGHSVACQRATSRTQVEVPQPLTPPERNRKKEKERTTTATADAADDRSRDDVNGVSPETAYAIGLTTAANLAISDRWGEQPNPLHFSSAAQLAVDLLDIGVDLTVARRAIQTAMARSRLERPPKAMEYFRTLIVEAHRADEQRSLNGKDKRDARGGPPARIADVLDPAIARQRLARERDYDRARKAAGVQWGKDPANADRYRAIVDAASTQFAELLKIQPNWATKGRDAEIILRCAEAAGFPDFESWNPEPQHAERQEIP